MSETIHPFTASFCPTSTNNTLVSTSLYVIRFGCIGLIYGYIENTNVFPKNTRAIIGTIPEGFRPGQTTEFVVGCTTVRNGRMDALVPMFIGRDGMIYIDLQEKDVVRIFFNNVYLNPYYRSRMNEELSDQKED